MIETGEPKTVQKELDWKGTRENYAGQNEK